MAGQGLRSVVVKKYNHHADHGSVPDDKENILKRDFEAGMVNRKWCTDITYIHVQKEGWIYLASVMDLCSRMTMPALNRSIQCKFISILTKTLRKPGGQSLNILKAGITASGSTVLSVIWRHSKRRMRS